MSNKAPHSPAVAGISEDTLALALLHSLPRDQWAFSKPPPILPHISHETHLILKTPESTSKINIGACLPSAVVTLRWHGLSFCQLYAELGKRLVISCHHSTVHISYKCQSSMSLYELFTLKLAALLLYGHIFQFVVKLCCWLKNMKERRMAEGGEKNYRQKSTHKFNGSKSLDCAQG